MKILQTVIAFVFVAVIAEGVQLEGSRASDFNLLDQRDRQIRLRDLEGKVVLLIASDDTGSKQNSEWKKATEMYAGRITVLGVADVRKVPFFLKKRFKLDFQKDPATILLDWEGMIFTSYGLAKDVANIVVIDKKGIVRYLYSGSAESSAVERLRGVLDKSLE